MSSNHTSDNLQCIHTDSTPRPATAPEAAETFVVCMERHILQNAINRIAAEEAVLRRVEQKAARLLGEANATADAVRTRIQRASAILRLAREACHQGRKYTRGFDASEASPTRVPTAEGEDNQPEDQEGDHPINDAKEREA